MPSRRAEVRIDPHAAVGTGERIDILCPVHPDVDSVLIVETLRDPFQPQGIGIIGPAERVDRIRLPDILPDVLLDLGIRKRDGLQGLHPRRQGLLQVELCHGSGGAQQHEKRNDG